MTREMAEDLAKLNAALVRIAALMHRLRAEQEIWDALMVLTRYSDQLAEELEKEEKNVGIGHHVETAQQEGNTPDRY